ncbi:FecR family protein [Candidatus Pantoea multigeneris]|uniref:Iron dicitrate transport regulator FecR n=1 Tax=Candidatus Pantoea multigeneris TaxID=2608357 RepID=A0ABX0RDQ0_9GAMM|nr:iron dicitrate transport regulator FecR [Pantoea multigeneris]
MRNEKLFEEAFDLIMRLHSEPENLAALARAESWRARGPQYQAVWQEAQHLHQLSGRLVPVTHTNAVAHFSRRRFITGGAVAIAATGATLAIAPDLLLPLRADHRTHTGQLQQLQLADGSHVTLGPDSAIRSHFSASQRQVDLLAGMAFFAVQPGAASPLIARQNGQQVVSEAGAFTLSQDADITSVAVEQGSVVVNGSQPLHAGQWLSISDSGQIALGERPVDQFAAWRSGMLVADNEHVAVVVARIARWLPGKVMIASAWLRQQRISGVFNLAHPQQALNAVVAPFQAEVRHLTPWLTLLSAK